MLGGWSVEASAEWPPLACFETQALILKPLYSARQCFLAHHPLSATTSARFLPSSLNFPSNSARTGVKARAISKSSTHASSSNGSRMPHHWSIQCATALADCSVETRWIATRRDVALWAHFVAVARLAYVKYRARTLLSELRSNGVRRARTRFEIGSSLSGGDLRRRHSHFQFHS